MSATLLRLLQYLFSLHCNSELVLGFGIEFREKHYFPCKTVLTPKSLGKCCVAKMLKFINLNITGVTSSTENVK